MRKTRNPLPENLLYRLFLTSATGVVTADRKEFPFAFPTGKYGRSCLYVGYCSIFLSAVLLQVCRTASIGVPGSNCYALDNSGHIYDFVSFSLALQILVASE